MKRKQKILVLLLLVAAGLAGPAARAQKSPYDAVYQYSVRTGSRRAYLWIPPPCQYVRGVIVALSNLTERNWLEDPLIRQTATAENLAIIWVGPGGRDALLTADMKPGAGKALQQMLDDLAEVSGYPEISQAPLLSMGHSANGHFSWRVPEWDASRVIAAFAFKTIPLPDSLGFTGVPLCYMVGQTTEWPQYRDARPGDRDFFWPVVQKSAVHLRMSNPDNLIGVVTDPGGGHFDWSAHDAKFMALFIRKACAWRLPEKTIPGRPVVLKKIDPASGWLTDTGGMDPDHFAPAPYQEYKGDKSKAYWFFDKETALAAAAFEGDRKPKKKQMLTCIQNGQLLAVADQGFASLTFEPRPDGLTFTLKGGFLKQLPPPLIGAGTPLGHAPGPIRFQVISGPAVQVNDTTFRVQFDRGGPGAVWLLESHPGNAIYRHAVQPVKLDLPGRLTEGTAQTIRFPPIADITKSDTVISLKARTGSGLPIGYYVVSGPAVVEGDHLRLTPIPVKTKYPVKVTVVAYQWGRTIAPKYRSADPVEQSFWIKK